eukprot:TRINITY_DN3396_c0_g3_i1.p1 TRINITY_DN3396_c0_g3~~TRINITY_DN3396_c0_g3_i1.p1  ORF type:complete len:988 (+),score=211.37 TRINITY_DN3396_c0_g3_i1:32-2995(+)
MTTIPRSATASSFASVHRPTIPELHTRLEAATSQKDLSLITAEAVSLVACTAGDFNYVQQVVNLLQHERFRNQANDIRQSLWFTELYKNVNLLSVLPLISWLYQGQSSFHVPEEWPDHLVRDLQFRGLECMRNPVVRLPISVFGKPAPRLPPVTIKDDSGLVASFVSICQDVITVLHDLQAAIDARKRLDASDGEAWKKTFAAVQSESLTTHIRDIVLLADKATNCVVMIPVIGCLNSGKSTVNSAAVGAQVTAIHTRACTSLPVMLQHCHGHATTVEISPAIIDCLSKAMAASPERVAEFQRKAAEGDAASRIEVVNNAFRQCVDQQLDVSAFFPPPVTSRLFGLPPLSRSMYPVVKVPFRALQDIPETPGTLVIVDTPGLFEHSQYEDHPYRRLVFDVLAHSAAVVVLVPLDQIDAEQTVQLSTIVESRISPTLDVYVVVTKVDDPEVGKSAAFESRLKELFPRAVAILPLCAQAALYATLAIDAVNAFLHNSNSDPDPRLVCLLNSVPADSYLMTLCKRMYGTQKSLKKLNAKPLKQFLKKAEKELRTSGLPALSKQVFQHMSNKVALTSINSYTQKLCSILSGISDQMYNAVHTASLSHEEQLQLLERLREASADLQSMQDKITAICQQIVEPFLDSVRIGVEEMFVDIQTHVSVLVRHEAVKAAEPLDKALTVEEVRKAAMTGAAQAPSIPAVTEAFWISCLPWVHYARLRDFVSMEKHFKASQVQTEFQSCGAILQAAVASCISSLIQRLSTQSEQLQVNLQAGVAQAVSKIVAAVQSKGFRVADIAKLTVDEPPLRGFSVPEKTEDLLRVNKTFFSSSTITNPEHIRMELLTQLEGQRDYVVYLLHNSVVEYAKDTVVHVLAAMRDQFDLWSRDLDSKARASQDQTAQSIDPLLVSRCASHRLADCYERAQLLAKTVNELAKSANVSIQARQPTVGLDMSAPNANDAANADDDGDARKPADVVGVRNVSLEVLSNLSGAM